MIAIKNSFPFPGYTLSTNIRELYTHHSDKYMELLLRLIKNMVDKG